MFTSVLHYNAWLLEEMLGLECQVASLFIGEACHIYQRLENPYQEISLLPKSRIFPRIQAKSSRNGTF